MWRNSVHLLVSNQLFVTKYFCDFHKIRHRFPQFLNSSADLSEIRCKMLQFMPLKNNEFREDRLSRTDTLRTCVKQFLPVILIVLGPF
jgi:hypothetical protein